ncbi:tRNA dimethylallyltransferase-like [Dendronephthya gigantea]|uniref:tRNA dimethylallyltransferase-like n=1 Tax=Dendronephthya gigantea TaxID=151771 RepID=UPI0010698F82|nr:tRNA dimethylallyltransferase-like [Dendronephthya gigantea]
MATDGNETEPFIIVILGCTGTGKSKLSLEIGKRINGEIISADSMQVYKGLDIITNKVTAEERATIPHHLLDFVDAKDKFSVVEFKTIALNVISDIIERQKVPIIVGGTNYYIESLLWENLIDERNARRAEDEEIQSEFQNVEIGERDEGGSACSSVSTRVEEDEREKRNEDNSARGGNPTSTIGAKFEKEEDDDSDSSTTGPKLNATEESSLEICHNGQKNSETPNSMQGGGDSKILDSSVPPCSTSKHTIHDISLHEQLAKVDLAMAQKLHPNDTRKIKRSLQVYQKSGVTHTEHISQQQSRAGSSVYSGPMRFKNVCVLWLQCEFETLDKRLDARVDQMIEQGLVQELIDFYISWKHESSESKMYNNEGIFQSIGFKEFREFLDGGNSKVEESPELFQSCVEAMKCATRRYARKQVRWVTNRFLGRPSTSSPDVYGLDATDLEKWKSEALEKALDIVKSFKTGQEVAHVPLERKITSIEAKHSNHTCTVCNGMIIIGDQNWEAHLRSRSHRRYRKKRQKFEEEVTSA